MALKTLKTQLKLQLLQRSSDSFGSGAPAPLDGLQVMAPPDLGRAWSRVKSVLLEAQLQQLWQDSKARATQRLSALCTSGGRGDAHHDPAAPLEPLMTPSASPEAPAVSQAELDAMYGSNGWLRSTVLSVIGHASQAFMHSANTVLITGGEHVRDAMARPAGQALITVCNHVAALDDPLVVASLLPPEQLDQPDRLRWTLCATDRCFKYQMLAPFFTAAKVLPVQRGAGLKQPGMVAAEQRLQQGDWVQVFPEGTRSRDPTHMNRVRPGVGRLVAAAASAPDAPAPIVLPFAHAGMEHVMPVGRKLPSIGHQVHVVVGEPVQVADLLQQARQEQWEQHRLYAAIALRVEESLQQLHAQAQSSLAASAPLQRRGGAAQVEEQAQSGMAASGSSRRDSLSEASVGGAGQTCGGGTGSSTSATSSSSAWRSRNGGGQRHEQQQQQHQGLWDLSQLRQWDRAAFAMWHRSWADSLTMVQAMAQHQGLAWAPSPAAH